MDYPANVKILRIPCTGKVDALYLLKALEDGVGRVIISDYRQPGDLRLALEGGKGSSLRGWGA